MKNILTIITICFALLSNAQQEAQFSQYYNNTYLLNPAAGGLSNVIQFNSGYRYQFTGIEGAPTSFYITGNSQFSTKGEKVIGEFNNDKNNVYATPENVVGKSKHIVGGKLSNDQIGPFAKTSVFGTYAYHLPFTSETMFGLGIGAGLSDLSINQNRITIIDQDDDFYNSFIGENANQKILDIQAGLTFYGRNFEFGLASTQLLKNTVKVNEIITSSAYARHLFFYGIYGVEVTSSLVLSPHFLIQKTGNTPTSFLIGTKLDLNRKFWADLSYRLGSNFSVGAGLNIARNFSLGYSFDTNSGPLQNATGNTHELRLGITLGSGRNIEKELDSRPKE